MLNARDAMPDGGRLMVEVRNNSLGQSDLDVNGEPRPGDYVMVAVTDTGCGMAADVASRAFEPFFTTKEVGKGTGLGLSMVYGFAQQSGGLVQLQSEPGQGSVVRLFFPRIAATLNEDRLPAEQIVAPDGSETVLVVEDDDMVRAYVESELKTLGYRVIASSNGPAALELLRQPRRHPSAVHRRRDARRHVRAGACAASNCLTARPQSALHLRLQPKSRQDARRVGDARILTKPFRRQDLAAMLRSALSAPSR